MLGINTKCGTIGIQANSLTLKIRTMEETVYERLDKIVESYAPEGVIRGDLKREIELLIHQHKHEQLYYLRAYFNEYGPLKGFNKICFMQKVLLTEINRSK